MAPACLATHAAGFVVNLHGTTLYFAGDTALFGDMALLSRLEKLDYALLPIGDNFTMGPDDVLEAAKLLQLAILFLCITITFTADRPIAGRL